MYRIILYYIILYYIILYYIILYYIILYYIILYYIILRKALPIDLGPIAYRVCHTSGWNPGLVFHVLSISAVFLSPFSQTDGYLSPLYHCRVFQHHFICFALPSKTCSTLKASLNEPQAEVSNGTQFVTRDLQKFSAASNRLALIASAVSRE